MRGQRDVAEDDFREAGLTIKDGFEVEEEFGEEDEPLEDLARVKDVEAEEEMEVEPIPAALIPLSFIVPNPNQPRQIFDEDDLNKMADTIKKKGRATNPVVVTPWGNRFMLISGERRWRASKIAGVARIPAEIKLEAGDELDIFEEAVIANLHQKKMTLPEEAYALKQLMVRRGWSQSELARRMGKETSEISNIFRLFRLDEELQAMLLSGKIKPGPILQLATYEVDVQMLLLGDLNEEVAARFDGRMPHHNIVAKILRRLAEARGIVPRKTERGKRVGSHAEMVVRSLRRATKKLRKEIGEFGSLTIEALKALGDSEVYSILSNLEQTAELIEDKCCQIKRGLNI